MRNSPVPRGTWKVSAVTGRSFTESRPTSATSGRVRKRSGVTGAPRQITEWTLAAAVAMLLFCFVRSCYREQGLLEGLDLGGRPATAWLRPGFLDDTDMTSSQGV